MMLLLLCLLFYPEYKVLGLLDCNLNYILQERFELYLQYLKAGWQLLKLLPKAVWGGKEEYIPQINAHIAHLTNDGLGV